MHLRAPTALAFSAIGRDLAVGLLLALLALAFGWLQPAYDLTIAGSDGSVYLAAAHQLAAGRALAAPRRARGGDDGGRAEAAVRADAEGRLPGGILSSTDPMPGG